MHHLMWQEDTVTVFAAALVRELCGGAFPDSGASGQWPSGFCWDDCEYRIEDGQLVPYAGGLPAPGPSLCLCIAAEEC